jgi:site-specific recombinase XerD
MLARCGLSHIRFHDLRHTFVTIMLDKGVPIIDVKYLARHTAIATTQQYAHKTPGHLEGVVKGIKVFEDSLRRTERRIDGGKNA